MKPVKWLFLLAVGGLAALPLFLWDQPEGPPPDFAFYQQDSSALRLVEVMSGRPGFERQDIVRKALDGASIAYREEVISNRIFRGTNTVVDIGNGRDILLFSAHTDRVDEAPGANDNASCIAAGIEALKKLTLLGSPENLTVRFLFSDGEETGLHGAFHHADNNDLSDYVGVASFELCGIGDAFGVWGVVGPARGSPIVEALLTAGDNLGIYNGTHGAVPRFGSDHLAFAKKGLAAVGVTVLPQADENRLRSYIEDPNNPMWLLNFIRPTIFQTYHTSGDGPDTVEAAALEMTTRLMLETVRVVGEMVKQS